MENQQTTQSKTISQEMAQACGSILFAALFGAFTSDDSHYKPCGENSSLYEWSHNVFILHLTNIGLSVVVLPVIACLFLGSSASLSKIKFATGTIK